MAMSELHQEILTALTAIKVNGPKDIYMGICDNVGQLLEQVSIVDNELIVNYLTELFSDWPDKSNSTTYPIGNWAESPKRLFWDHYDHDKSMWNKRTKYGQARWALLDHCISKLSQK